MKTEPFPILNPGEVHVWSTSFLNHQNDIDYFSSLLSQNEREQAESYRFYKDQYCFIISRGVLRSLLGNYLKQAPGSIEITCGTWGKPILTISNILHFNLSHSRDYVLYAVTKDYEVGIDLEYKDKNIKIGDMVPYIFSESELKYWKSLNHEDGLDFFFKLWVCKEATLKASGKGWLGDDEDILLKNINIIKKKSRNASFFKETIEYPYYFECISGYASALCIEGPPLRHTYYIWD